MYTLIWKLSKKENLEGIHIGALLSHAESMVNQGLSFWNILALLKHF